MASELYRISLDPNRDNVDITEHWVSDHEGRDTGWLVPVEPDYEAAAKILQSDESMTSWLMWATTIVDAALLGALEGTEQEDLDDENLRNWQEDTP